MNVIRRGAILLLMLVVFSSHCFPQTASAQTQAGNAYQPATGNFQEAPGSIYPESSIWVSDRFYRPEYLQEVTYGARPAADYAPAGYEARDFQDAPGSPEYEQLTTPILPSQAERDRYVTGGMYPGSFLVPGTNTSMRLRGFVRLGGTLDLDPIGSTDDFVTNRIPVPQESGQNSNFSARFSRIALDTWTPTTFQDWNVHTLIEFDFFSGNPPMVGASHPARLRFAFVDFGPFRIGQQNSVFMDSSSFPSTADFAGPRGLVNLRRPAMRVTLPVGESWYWASEVAQPFSDITTHGLGENVQDVPDFASHLRYQGDLGHIQAATLLRSIGYRPAGAGLQRETAWGVNLSSNFHPWAMLQGTDPLREENPSGLTRSRVLLQCGFGQGIGRFVQDTAGLGLDGQVDPATGDLQLLHTTGWSASYEHWFCENWLCNTTYSQAHVNSRGNQPANTYAGADYLACSLWWIPVRNMSIGLEYLHGTRENFDGQSANANRIQTLFQYNF